MSMILCEMCGGMINSDADPACFVDDFWTSEESETSATTHDGVICKTCRENHLEALEQ